MSLQFEQNVIRDTVRGVPTVPNTHFLVLSVRQFLPAETVVLNEVDGLQVNYRKESFQNEENTCLHVVEVENECCENKGFHNTKNRVVKVERFTLFLFLHFVDTLVRS